MPIKKRFFLAYFMNLWVLLLSLSLNVYADQASLSTTRQETVVEEKLPNIQDALNIENLVPALVIGSGPAGLSAAMYLGRAEEKPIVITGPIPGGLLTHVKEIENWPGKPKMRGIEAIEALRAQAEQFGATIINDVVTKLDVSSWPFTVQTKSGLILRPLTIIVATGRTPIKKEVPGVDRYWGKGIGSCTICEAPFQRGNITAVFGSGLLASERAQQLAVFAKKVYLISPTDKLTVSSKIQELLEKTKNIEIILDADLVEARGNDKSLTGITIKNNKTGTTTELDVRGFYFALGYQPASKLIEGILKTDKDGLILLKDRTHATSVPGIFAGGDIVDLKYGKAGVATGSGIKAALDAINFLQKIGYQQYADQLEKYFYAETKRTVREIPSIDTLNQLKHMLAEQIGLVLLEFYSPECPQCRMLMPVVQAVASEYQGKVAFFKHDVDKHDELWDHFRITTVPYFMLFKNGELIGEAQDIQSKHELVNLIKQFITEKK